ncbi:unnamed protein product [Brassica oleracea]
MEEAIVLLMLLVKKMVVGGIQWDAELVDHLAYALSMVGQFILPGVYIRGERWCLLSLCYSAAGMGKTAINLLKLALGPSESRQSGSLLLKYGSLLLKSGSLFLLYVNTLPQA